MAEAVKVNLSERDDIADILGLIPQWFIGALLWATISELVLKRLYPDDFIKLQTAILGADIVGEMPPGVAMVALAIKVTLRTAPGGDARAPLGESRQG